MLRLTINRTSWMVFRDTLEALTPFRTSGNLFGTAGPTYEVGRLPEPHRSEYRDRSEFIDYTVVSYSTPLAWHDTERGWIMPDVRYSVTTSRAQGRIAPGIAALNAEAWAGRVDSETLAAALSTGIDNATTRAAMSEMDRRFVPNAKPTIIDCLTQA
jgi:hypothetical protein